MEMHELRKINLRARIGSVLERGAVAAFAKEHNLNETYVRQILNNHRTMGEKAARKFEETLRLPKGYLDQHHIRESETAPYHTATLSETAIAVAEAFESSSPELQAAALRMLGVLQDIDNPERD